MIDLGGKVILITGASSGIGKELARILAKDGAKLFLGARREDKLKNIVAEIRQNNGIADYQILDVTDIESVRKFTDKAINLYGKIDVLINNAGVMLLSNVRESLIEDWYKMINVNLVGVLNMTSAILPHMKKQYNGHIINIGSTASYRVSPGSSIYSATKYAVRAFSDGLRKEETNNGIKVTLIAPGPVKTELTNHIPNQEIKEHLTEYVKEKGIDVVDIAYAVEYALSLPKNANIDELIISTTSKQ